MLIPLGFDLRFSMLAVEIPLELESHTCIQYANTVKSRSMVGCARRRNTIKEAAEDVHETMHGQDPVSP
jgi:hypothetical protein